MSSSHPPTTTTTTLKSHLLTAPRPHLLLDGGLATHLETLGATFTNTLWSASLLSTNPSLIQRAHYDYFVAGADVAITASYQASTRGLCEGLGVSEAEARALVGLSVEVARGARGDVLALLRQGEGPGEAVPKNEKAGEKKQTRPLFIIGSIGPYAAYLANGSEYTGAYDPLPPHEDFKTFHRPRIQALAEAGVDGFAIETFPRLDEVKAVLEVLREEARGVACWVSVTLKSAPPNENVNEDGDDDICLADGTPLTQLCELVRNNEQVLGIGVNCVARDVVSGALNALRQGMRGWKEEERKALVVYPNSGELWDGVRKVWMSGGDGDGGKEGKSCEEWLEEWIDVDGARGLKERMIVGGCCRVEPEEIARMRVWLDERCRQ